MSKANMKACKYQVLALAIYGSIQTLCTGTCIAWLGPCARRGWHQRWRGRPAHFTRLLGPHLHCEAGPRPQQQPCHLQRVGGGGEVQRGQVGGVCGVDQPGAPAGEKAQ